jgi:hypothetical protein
MPATLQSLELKCHELDAIEDTALAPFAPRRVLKRSFVLTVVIRVLARLQMHWIERNGIGYCAKSAKRRKVLP